MGEADGAPGPVRGRVGVRVQGQCPGPNTLGVERLPLSDIHVFVSSTVKDLRLERQTVKQAVGRIGVTPFLSEESGASHLSPNQLCFDEVRAADIYILLVGESYGAVPAPMPAADGQAGSDLLDGRTSVTHAEFKLACRLNKPILVYIKTTDKREHEVDSLVTSIEGFHTGFKRCRFSRSEELAQQVTKDVGDVIASVFKGKFRHFIAPEPKVVCCENPAEAQELCARFICAVVRRRQRPVLGLMAGNTAGGVYGSLEQILAGDPNLQARFGDVRTFHAAERFGVHETSPSSYRSWMMASLYDKLERLGVKLDLSKIHFVPGVVMSNGLDTECHHYNNLVSQHGIDLQLVGMAPNGESMGIDPDRYDPAELRGQRTSLVEICEYTYDYIVPRAPAHLCVTIGMGNVLRFSKRVVLVACGEDKAAAVRNVLTSNDTRLSPCSILKTHNDFWLVIDRLAASALPAGWERHFSRLTYEDALRKFDPARATTVEERPD